MDRSTFSNYGWLIIAVVVVSIMIVLATPLGDGIKEGLYTATDSMNDRMSIVQDGQVSLEDHSGAVKSWNIGATSANINYNGSNGADSVTATLYKDGKLVVTGSGNVTVFSNTADAVAPWCSSTYKNQVKSSVIASTVKPTSMKYWYQYCSNLTAAPTIPSSVTDMSRTFLSCTALTQAPDIPSGVTAMGYTFDGCTALTQAPDIPSSVTDMRYTFNGCTALTQAPAIPSSVTNMYATFFGCTSLTQAPKIPASVTNMYSTFLNCGKLTGTMTIMAVPGQYGNCFINASTDASASLTVNYTSNCTNIDNIIATKSAGSHITKGVQID